jgi:hypothetical protein
LKSHTRHIRFRGSRYCPDDVDDEELSDCSGCKDGVRADWAAGGTACWDGGAIAVGELVGTVVPAIQLFEQMLSLVPQVCMH